MPVREEPSIMPSDPSELPDDRDPTNSPERSEPSETPQRPAARARDDADDFNEESRSHDRSERRRPRDRSEQREPPAKRSNAVWWVLGCLVAAVGFLVGVGIFVAVLGVAATRSIEDAKQSSAHLKAREISQAAELYKLSPKNPTMEYPTRLEEMVLPPFGGPPFLNDQEALLDPWGKPFQMEVRAKSSGDTYILISTTAPDGTPISNFGIGPAAKPTF